MDEDQARAFFKSSRFYLLLERQQGFAGVQRFEGNAAGLFGLINEFE